MDATTTNRRPTRAVVLAAGDGMRLRPLTDHVPKPLLPIDGTAVLDRVLGQLVDVGIEQATIVVGHHGELVADFSRAHARGLRLAFVDQPERVGTGRALQLVRAAGGGDERVLVCAADTAWRDEDVHALLDSHARDHAIATMALLRWPIEQLPHQRLVRMGDSRAVTSVLDHIDPSDRVAGASALSGTPVYVLEPEMWRRIANVATLPSGAVALWRALQDAIDDGEVVRGVEFTDARDLTDPGDLLRANFPYLGRWLDEAKIDA